MTAEPYIAQFSIRLPMSIFMPWWPPHVEEDGSHLARASAFVFFGGRETQGDADGVATTTNQKKPLVMEDK